MNTPTITAGLLYYCNGVIRLKSISACRVVTGSPANEAHLKAVVDGHDLYIGTLREKQAEKKLFKLAKQIMEAAVK